MEKVIHNIFPRGENSGEGSGENSTDLLERGVLALVKLEDEARGILDVIRAKGKALVRVRFQQGRCIAALLEHCESEYGSGFMARLEQGTGISKTVLYLCLQFYQLPELRGSDLELERWLETKAEDKGKAVTWSYVRNYLAKQLGPGDERKAEHHTDRLEKRTENLEKDADDLEREVGHMNGEVRAMAEGVVAKAREVAQDLRRQVQTNGVPKTLVPRSPDYLDFVRSLPCAVTGREAPSEPHHVEQGGMGMKGSDFSCVPLCHEVHRFVEDQGHAVAETEYGFSFATVIAQTLHQFVTGQSFQLPRDIAFSDEVPF